MTFEPPQKTNPHKLTVNQHTFPSASIARYANKEGAVQVFHKSSQRMFYAKPSDQTFGAQRIWDQRAEAGFMKDIEDTFQTLASMLDDPAFQMGPQHFSIINEFYCLWNIRAQRKKIGHTADPSVGTPEVIGLRRNYTKDEQEQLEAAGIGYIRPDFTVSSRFLVAPSIQLQLSNSTERMKMRDITWRLLKADDGEFIVPDNFFNLLALPLSPTRCLYAHPTTPSGRLNRCDVADINREAVATSYDYYFARDLSLCPL
ncbi:hypothetical protein [Pseudomonas syringae group genomosp. 3]|uniref:hypothetical protein n=1 Tax=Pseudomonas syringae group genomosp. 3 TaxID=251701 RepID=UPI000EFFF149|nr:hypothetical protein [Pseudomonas syringae group genomosp. 3]